MKHLLDKHRERGRKANLCNKHSERVAIKLKLRLCYCWACFPAERKRRNGWVGKNGGHSKTAKCLNNMLNFSVSTMPKRAEINLEIRREHAQPKTETGRSHSKARRV